jgi:hypothetical protein
MAQNNTNNKPKTAKSQANKNKSTQKQQNNTNTAISNKVAEKAVKQPVSLDELVTVQSCVGGQLIWVSPRTGYKIKWNEFGNTNPMTVADLLDMRNGSTRVFFEKNWVAILGDRADDIMEYLQIKKYYKNVYSADDIDRILTSYEPDEIEAVVAKMPASLKNTVVFRAREMKANEELDSYQAIAAVEKAVGVKIEA